LSGHFRPDGVLLELGGFWSFYSLWFLHGFAERRAIVVEPDPAKLAVGRRDFALNRREGLMLQAAIGEESAAAVEHCCESDGVVRNLPRLSVDDLLDRYDVRSLEVLHCDIQGAELGMLRGARGAIVAGRVRFLFLSTHHHAISGDPLTHQRCLHFVRSHGGRVLAEHTVPESYSGDGLIAASFAPADAALPEITVSRNRAAASFFREIEYDFAEALGGTDT